MDGNRRGDETDGSRFVGRIEFRRSRSGKRLWPAKLKGRIVRESLAPGVRVADVARRYGICAQQLTEWRRAARSGRLALVTDDPAEFVAIELNEAAAVRSEADAKIEIAVGKVVLRLEGDTASTRIADIVTALERGA
jgi:transposase